MSSAGTGHVARDPSAPEPLRTPESQAADPARAGPSGGHNKWWAAMAKVAPAAIPALVVAVLGLWGLARGSSVGNDEAATTIAAQLSLGQLAHLVRHVDAVHGLYYLLMHGWAAIGTSPVALRIPSLIAMTAAAAMIAILTVRLTRSGWAGLFAGLIMALTPAISFYAQTARAYALVYACVTGATLALLAALRAETTEAVAARVRRLWLLYGGLIALGGYLNEMSLLVLAAHAVTVALGRYRPVALRHWALAGGAGAALVIPLVLISARQHASVSWISRPGATDLRILVQDYFAVAPVAAAVLIACAIVAVLPVRAGNAGTPVSARWWLRAGVSLPSVALPLLIVPAVILIGESLVGPPLYVDRYVLFGESGAALLAGTGLYRVGQWLRTATGRRWLVWAPGAIACLAVLLLQIGAQQDIRTPGSRLYDFTGPARYLGANARPGDGVLFFDNFFRKDRLVYPRDFRNTDDFGQAESPAQAGSFRGTDKPFATSLPLMLGHRRIWVVGVAPSPRLRTLLLRQQSLALLQHFTLVGQRRFRGIDVTLWMRRPGTVPPGPTG
jgi:mannosyltransferase